MTSHTIVNLASQLVGSPSAKESSFLAGLIVSFPFPKVTDLPQASLIINSPPIKVSSLRSALSSTHHPSK